MNSIIPYKSSSLPSIPVAFSLNGENLDKKSLILNFQHENVEQVICQFRAENSPESLPYFRRYYLKPHKRGSLFDGRYSIRYVWNLKNSATDRTVGVFKGDDLPAAQILIGNHVAGAWMTPIRWEISEDRDGEEPIAIGRFDPWSLLQDVSTSDLERLKKCDLTPNLPKWDFDLMFMRRACPSCGKNLSVNCFAYNIDSAKCCHCGIRPFLSFSLGKSFMQALPSVTGKGTQIIGSDKILLHAVQWMGSVNASVQDLHREELPEGITPHILLKQLLHDSHLVTEGRKGDIQLHPSVLAKFTDTPDGQNIIATVHSAANTLAQAIESGIAFTPMHSAIASMLQAIKH